MSITKSELTKIQNEIERIKAIPTEDLQKANMTVDNACMVALMQHAARLRVTLDSLKADLVLHEQDKTAHDAPKDQGYIDQMNKTVVLQNTFLGDVNTVMLTSDDDIDIMTPTQLRTALKKIKNDSIALRENTNDKTGRLAVTGDINFSGIYHGRNTFQSMIIFWTHDGILWSPYSAGWVDQGKVRGQYHSGRHVSVAKSTGYIDNEISTNKPTASHLDFYGIELEDFAKQREAKKAKVK